MTPVLPTLRRADVARAFSVMLACVAGCGADVEPYKPSLGGIRNENIDPNAPPQDVSFVDGENITRTTDTACGEQAPYFPFSVVVASEYRQRVVVVRPVDSNCNELPATEVGPGRQETIPVTSKQVVRVYDKATGEVINAWFVKQLNSLKTERIVLRSTSPTL